MGGVPTAFKLILRPPIYDGEVYEGYGNANQSRFYYQD